MKTITQVAIGLAIAAPIGAVMIAATTTGTVEDEPTAPVVSSSPEPKFNRSQENAVETAQMYVDTMAFSRKGLIIQMTSKYGNKFPREDALFAVNHIEVDWNEEAVEAAENYLSVEPYSKEDLRQQLKSPHGDRFTSDQADYAISKVY